MRIAIDVQPLFSPHTKGRGVAVVLQNQIEALLREDTDNEYILFNIYSAKSALEEFGDHPALSEFHLFADFMADYKTAEGEYVYEPLLKSLVQKFLQREQIDVFYMCSPFDWWDFYRPEWFVDARLVVMVHDLIPMLFPELFLTNETEQRAYERGLALLRGANALVAISHNTQKDLLEHGFEAEKIHVAYNGIADRYFSLPAVDKADADAIRKQYGIQQAFIFCAGGDNVRKNMPEMVEAYTRLPRKLIDEHQLVVVCALSDRTKLSLAQVVRRAGLPDDRLVLTGYVPDERMVQLYQLSELVFFASRYEGFGLPVIEAMACGTPVVTSNNSSLGEIGKDTAILVDPEDVHSMEAGLQQGLTMDWQDTLPAMHEKAKDFTWKNNAKTMLCVFAACQRETQASDKQTPKHVRKLAVFTPLPPLNSGISDYSAELIRTMATHCSIDIFVDDGYLPQFQCENVEILNHREFESRKELYDDVLYQMGNSGFHYYMMDYIRRFSGTVELHDVNLHLFLYHEAVEEQKDFSLYEAFVAEDYPRLAPMLTQQVRLGRQRADHLLLPLNGVVTNYADKVIVHSEYARQKLLEMHIERDVYVVQHLAYSTRYPAQAEARRRLKMPLDATVFSTFGALTEDRRLLPLVKAFAPLAQNNPALHLYMTGADVWYDHRPDFEHYLREYGVAGQVHFTGRLSEDDLIAHTAACDVCVSMRWPYKGESSGIVARILPSGKPLVVTDVGSFAELPDSCCLKVPPPQDDLQEVAALYQALHTLAESTDLRAEMGNAARQYAEEELSAAKISENILSILTRETRRTVLTNRAIREMVERNIYSSNIEMNKIDNISCVLAYLK